MKQQTEAGAGRGPGNESAPGYRIGTVASLTGVDAHTIRAWERRHGAIEPERSRGGTRFYSDEQVERLRLIKALTDCGDPIGRVAGLSDDVLRARLHRLAGLADAGSARDAVETARVALLDPTLVDPLRLSAAGAAPLEVVLCEESTEALLAGLGASEADVVVMALERMGPNPLRTLQACREIAESAVVVVVFEFARRRDLARLVRRGARLVRGPVDVPLLHRAILDFLAMREARRRTPSHARRAERPSAVPAPARRFSDSQLARLREIASPLDCECPRHLASLVSSLLAFERYSRECESRNEDDAALHARLARGTAEARNGIEQLLVEVCATDRIAV